MYFLLHHSTGTLMLNASDKGEVLSWTERQLGEAAKRAAVLELNEDRSSDWVERSGTGMSKEGCEVFLSVMADSIQRVVGNEVEDRICLDQFQTNHSKLKRVSVH